MFFNSGFASGMSISVPDGVQSITEEVEAEGGIISSFGEILCNITDHPSSFHINCGTNKGRTLSGWSHFGNVIEGIDIIGSIAKHDIITNCGLILYK